MSLLKKKIPHASEVHSDKDHIDVIFYLFADMFHRSQNGDGSEHIVIALDRVELNAAEHAEPHGLGNLGK